MGACNSVTPHGPPKLVSLNKMNRPLTAKYYVNMLSFG